MSLMLAAAASVAFAGQAAQDTMEFRRLELAPAETVAVGTIGEGPPIVIVPGILGSAYSFRAVIGPLAAEGYRVVVIDPLGTGRSGRAERADYSLAAQAGRIGGASREAGISRALFVCHSTSAAMCYRLAHAEPGLVAGIVSINGGAAERQSTSGMRIALKVAGVIRFIAGDGWARGKIKDGLRKSSADPAWVTDEIVAAYTGYYPDGMGSALGTLKRIAGAEEPDSLAPKLAQIITPVHLLYGAGGTEGKPSSDELVTLSALPRLEIDTVAGAGAYIHEEKPGAVVDAVLSLAQDVLVSPRIAVPDLRTSTIRLPARNRN